MIVDSTPPARPRAAGFTLLELVLAMLLMSILVGMVFSTARSSLMLGNTIVESQNEEMLHQAFFELLSQRFSTLPGNTRLDLKFQENTTPYLSDLTLQNVPLSFNWGGQARIAKAIQLSTVKRRSGYLDIVLKYYENEILENPSSPAKPKEEKPFAEIVLLTDVRYFEWRVLDSRNATGKDEEWQYDWDQQGRLPLRAELVMAIGAGGEELRQVFWIPPKVNPETLIGQFNQGNPSGDNGVPNPELLNPGLPALDPPNNGGGGGGNSGGARPPGNPPRN